MTARESGVCSARPEEYSNTSRNGCGNTSATRRKSSASSSRCSYSDSNP
ncbi:hypothetical protein [Streptomyces flaveolus]